MTTLLVPEGEKKSRYDEIPDGTILFRIIDATGDSKHFWDTNKKDEIDLAKKMFGEFKKKGYTAYYIKESGQAGNVMTEFDSSAKMVIFKPQMKGG